MLAYCDFIADAIKKAFTNDKPENLVAKVGPIKMDLHPIDGYFLSTKKTIMMEDVNGKMYKVTIEEASEKSHIQQSDDVSTQMNRDFQLKLVDPS